MIPIWLLGTVVISYTLGSIPFGLILARIMGYGDLRKIGSGNIGATNALRTGNKKLAIATLLLDATKGAAAVMLCDYYYNHSYALIGGLIVVLGHVFPVWLAFRGGKGVATALGAFFGLCWPLGLLVCLLWLAVFLTTRISSLSALFALGYSPLFAYIFEGYLLALLALLVATLILFTHRANVERLLAGKEHRFAARARA